MNKHTCVILVVEIKIFQHFKRESKTYEIHQFTVFIDLPIYPDELLIHIVTPRSASKRINSFFAGVAQFASHNGFTAWWTS